MENSEKLISAVFDFGRVMRERIGSVNFSHNLSHGQIQTLKFIESNKGRTMKEISSFLRVRPPTATTMINSLVKSGEIKRVDDEGDRRITKLELTKKGEKILKESFGTVAKELKSIFSKLNDKDIENLINILEKIK
ncbi:MAG: MarR family transcriptional regulator [bacterium]